MSIRYVEFTDATETAILTAFAGPQPWPEYYPHQGTVEDTEARWVAFLERISSFVPMYNDAIISDSSD